MEKEDDLSCWSAVLDEMSSPKRHCGDTEGQEAMLTSLLDLPEDVLRLILRLLTLKPAMWCVKFGTYPFGREPAERRTFLTFLSRVSLAFKGGGQLLARCLESAVTIGPGFDAAVKRAGGTLPVLRDLKFTRGHPESFSKEILPALQTLELCPMGPVPDLVGLNLVRLRLPRFGLSADIQCLPTLASLSRLTHLQLPDAKKPRAFSLPAGLQSLDTSARILSALLPPHPGHHYTSLTQLAVHCSTDLPVEALEMFPAVRELSVSCPRWASVTLQSWLERQIDKLETLSLYGSHQPRLAPLGAGRFGSVPLRKLELNFRHEVAVLDDLFCSAPNLAEVVLNSSALDDKCLLGLLRNATQLRTLRIASCACVTAEDLTQLSSDERCRVVSHLQHVSILFCPRLTNKGLAMGLFPLFSGLISLELGDRGQWNNGGLASVDQLTRLEELTLINLSGCSSALHLKIDCLTRLQKLDWVDSGRL